MAPPDLQARLRDIRIACDLGPLQSASALEKYWVNTDDARDPHQSVREVIRLKLEDHKDPRLLFYGHGGSGKSTELAKLIQELGDKWFVVSFSIRNEMSLTSVASEDIILVLMERLVARADEMNLGVDASSIGGIQQYFAAVTRHSENSRHSEVGFEAAAGVKTPSVLSPLLKLFAGLKAEIKLESGNKETRVERVRQRPAELLAQSNILVNAVRQALPADQRLLLLVEDLDKLDIASARRVFIEKTNILTGLNAAVVYTIPIFAFHSPDAGILRRAFDQAICLPMVKVAEPGGDPAPGADIVKEIIRRRVGADALTESALDLLVRKTGGVLQHAFEVLESTALMRGVAVPLDDAHIRYGLQRRKNEFWTEITLPFDPIPGLQSKDQLFDRLVECAKNQRAGKKNNPTGDPIDQVLLRCCALVEYNGCRWFGVHPLVQEILEDLGRL